MRWIVNLGFGAYGAILPIILGYGFGSLAAFHDWRMYVLVAFTAGLGQLTRLEGMEIQAARETERS